MSIFPCFFDIQHIESLEGDICLFLTLTSHLTACPLPLAGIDFETPVILKACIEANKELTKLKMAEKLTLSIRPLRPRSPFASYFFLRTKK